MQRFSSFTLSALILLILSGTLLANGLSLNSIGTRALGMGGAFIGVANDASAIYWNPAGLTGAGSQILVFGTDIIPMATYKNSGYGIDAEAKINHYMSPNLFASYSMGKMAFGLGLFVPAGLGAEWEGKDLVAFGGPAAFDPNGSLKNPFAGKEYKWRSEIGVFSISPTFAYQISEKLSIGAAVNIYYGMFDMERPVDAVNVTSKLMQGQVVVTPGPDQMMDNQYEETGTGLGYGVSLGLMLKPVKQLNIGLSLRTESTIKFEGTAKNTAFTAYNAYESDYARDMTWPLWLGAGIGYMPTDYITFALDVQYSRWSKTEDVLTTDYKDPVWDQQLDQQDENKMELHWKDATQIRFGMEVKATKDLAIRSGYYYDPAPAPDKTLNILFPSSTNHTVAAGLGYSLNNLMFDLSAEYLFGEARNIEDNGINGMPGRHQMDIFAFSFGLGYAL